MIASELIDLYKNTANFSSIDLTGEFADYMKGVEVGIEPTLSFDDLTGKEYTTYIGSLYFGGNVGSMSAPGTFDMDFDEPIVIYDRIVGGCNDANVDTIFAANGIDVLLTPYYKGGLITRPESEDDPKVRININSGNNGNTVRLLPKNSPLTALHTVWNGILSVPVQTQSWWEATYMAAATTADMLTAV